VQFLWQGVQDGFRLLADGDPYIYKLIWVTLRVAVSSTAVALVVGLPIGLALGVGRFRGRRTGLALGNAGLALPPVLLGLIVALISFPEAPLGGLHLLYSLKGVIVAQTLLALPIVIALTAAATQAVPRGLIGQARALGARRWHVGLLALREARVGVMAAIIAAFGSALSEVGAVVLVGGNIEGYDQTLASATLEQVNAGHYAQAMAIGIVLLGLILVLVGLLTALQQRGAVASVRVRAPS
jgi:tungstate transport system permease protein